MMTLRTTEARRRASIVVQAVLLLALVGLLGQGFLGPHVGVMGWFVGYLILIILVTGGSVVIGILVAAWEWIREADH